MMLNGVLEEIARGSDCLKEAQAKLDDSRTLVCGTAFDAFRPFFSLSMVKRAWEFLEGRAKDAMLSELQPVINSQQMPGPGPAELRSVRSRR